MKKIMILAVLLSIVMSVSAQMFELQATSKQWCDGELESSDATITIKDEAWVSSGGDHIILFDSFEKKETDEGNTYFESIGIDWEGEECSVSICRDLGGTGVDGVLLYWDDDRRLWYYGELKPLK